MALIMIEMRGESRKGRYAARSSPTPKTVVRPMATATATHQGIRNAVAP